MPVAQGPKGVEQEMHKFKHGELHSGSKEGPTVTNPKQAIAIALHEAGMSKPKKKGKLRIGNRSYQGAWNLGNRTY